MPSERVFSTAGDIVTAQSLSLSSPLTMLMNSFFRSLTEGSEPDLNKDILSQIFSLFSYLYSYS